MGESIIVALITGLVSLIGTVLTVKATSKKTDENMRVNQEVMKTEIKNLTREVREHNNFAKRMPVVEEQIKTLNHEIDQLKKSAG